jgi:AI-2 transport protein TqsA
MSDHTETSYNKIIAYLLGFVSFVLFVYILIALREILIPITIAIFLTFLFYPLIIYLTRFKIPKWLSLVIIVIVVSGLYYLVGLILVSSFSTFPEKLQAYSENLSAFIQSLLSPFNITLKEFSEFLNIKIKEFDVESVFQKLFEAGVIQNIFNSFSGVFGDTFIAMIFWVFMIMGKDRFEERLKHAFRGRKEFVEKNLDTINEQLQSYIIIKTILSLATSIIATVILWIFGVDFAIVWGLLTFILNYIPNIGSLIATVGPIIVSLLEYGLGLTTVSISVLLLLNQNIIGNLIEPHYLGRHMDLSPVFVLFSLIFWGWIWGIVGMFLAVPIAAAMKILFSNIGPLKPVAILMGRKTADADQVGKPAKLIKVPKE